MLKKSKTIIIVMLTIIGIIVILSNISIITKKEKNNENYKIIELSNYDMKKESASLKEDNKKIVISDDEYNLNISSKKEDFYGVNIYVDENLEENRTLNIGNNFIKLKLEEGKHIVKIIIKEKDEIINIEEKQIDCIKKQEHQFLEELSKNGLAWHILNLSIEETEKSLKLLNELGIKDIRIEIKSQEVIRENNKLNFEKYDKKMKLIEQYGMIPIIILDTNMGTNKKITNNQELEKYLNYVENIQRRYPFIEYYEVCNEPNHYYLTNEEMNWYAKVVKETKEKNKEKKVLAGSTIQKNSQEFLNQITKAGAYQSSDIYSYHYYTLKPDNMEYSKYIKEQEDFKNKVGGFQKYYITETGLPSIERIGEKQQADIFVQQANIRNKYGIKKSIIYNFRNTGNNILNYENNYGVVNNDYTPKLSYYAMKNFSTNTNGSEYIGTIDTVEGLEAHVYNKDGKPKIIIWSNKKDNNIEIEYKDFTAKDIFGKNIENQNGKLTITTSPIYLDNISEKYYYQAISKTIIEKYNEFKNKYSEEINQIQNLNTNIKEMEKYITEVGKTTLKLPEESTKKAIEQHYALGENILNAYKIGEIKIEYVKISSMLDFIDDIGNSYEDLITISAKTRNVDLEKAKEQIDEVKKIIDSNADLNMIYPSKIIEFSKDYYEKSSYINGIEEENDIKTGLVVSKNMHSKELSKLAKEFTEIYIEQHIKNNPITVDYSEKNITNQDVKTTLNIKDDCIIKNNNGNKEYIFKENGEFIFEYTRRGKIFSEKITINYIDKKSPEIKGVEQWKVYTQSVIPIVTDENLEKIELIVNGQTINGYNSGTEITEEGLYQIIATDKAGNITKINFEIIKNIEKGYKIENGLIKNITGSTKKTDFENQLSIKYKYTIKRENKEIETNAIIATGDILETEGKEKYILIVNGDINKDGIVSIIDLVKIKRKILGEIEFNEIEKKAADANQDNEDIGIKDLVRLRILILKQ